MSADRIPCLNPNCRRTFARRPEDRDDTETVCGKCWKLLPKALTARHRQVMRRWRAINRKVERRQAKGQPYPRGLWDLLSRQHRDNWSKIRAYLLNPPAPEGLENFLKEVGLN